MIKLFTIKSGKVHIFGITKAMIMAIITSSLVVSIAGYFKISQEDLWKFIVAIQQHFNIQWGENLDEQIRNDEKLLDFVVKNKVNKAIYDYEQSTGDTGEVRIPSPIYSEKPIDPTLQTGEAKLLGGEMRLCAPWVDDCPKN
jgi:hypothetical protein